nr:MAG: hypothetical protein [Bacteriophage sp.]
MAANAHFISVSGTRGQKGIKGDKKGQKGIKRDKPMCYTIKQRKPSGDTARLWAVFSVLKGKEAGHE